MATAMTQLNARIGVDLKREGDAVFAEYGIGTSDAVRSLWSYAASQRKPPSFMVSEAEGEQAARCKEKMALISKGAGLVRRMVLGDDGVLAGAGSAGGWADEFAALRDEARTARADAALGELDGIASAACKGGAQ